MRHCSECVSRMPHCASSLADMEPVLPSGISSMPAVRRLMSARGNVSGPCMYSSCLRSSCCSLTCIYQDQHHSTSSRSIACHEGLVARLITWVGSMVLLTIASAALTSCVSGTGELGRSACSRPLIAEALAVFPGLCFWAAAATWPCRRTALCPLLAVAVSLGGSDPPALAAAACVFPGLDGLAAVSAPAPACFAWPCLWLTLPS